MPFSAYTTFFSSSSSIIVFVKHACHPGTERRLDQVHKVVCINFKIFQIHPLVVTYYTTRKDHGIDLNFVSKNLFMLFWLLSILTVVTLERCSLMLVHGHFGCSWTSLCLLKSLSFSTMPVNLIQYRGIVACFNN